jgi:hypothetical protein
VGLHVCCRKPTADESGLLPDVIMTSDVDWDPKIYDTDLETLNAFYDLQLNVGNHVHPFNAYGEYCNCTVASHHLVEEEEYNDTIEYN